MIFICLRVDDWITLIFSLLFSSRLFQRMNLRKWFLQALQQHATVSSWNASTKPAARQPPTQGQGLSFSVSLIRPSSTWSNACQVLTSVRNISLHHLSMLVSLLVRCYMSELMRDLTLRHCCFFFQKLKNGKFQSNFFDIFLSLIAD